MCLCVCVRGEGATERGSVNPSTQKEAIIGWRSLGRALVTPRKQLKPPHRRPSSLGPTTINSHLKTAATWRPRAAGCGLPPGAFVGNVIGEMHVCRSICMWQVNGACNREGGYTSVRHSNHWQGGNRRVWAHGGVWRELVQLMGLTHACGQCVWNSIEFIARACFAAQLSAV